MTESAPGPGTILARAGRLEREAGSARGAESLPEPLTEPIALSSVYRFEDLDQVDGVWDGRRPGYIYRRFGHPNATTLERVVAALEGADGAVACASGMGAIFAALGAHLVAGDVVLGQQGLYGGTQTLLSGQLARFGVGTAFAPEPVPESFAQTLEALGKEGRRVRALLVESIANPSLKVADLRGLGELALERGLLLVVDNTFATPLGCRPLRFGPALVVHSATKYLNGHSDVVGGVVAGPRELVEAVRKVAISFGVTMSAMDAWLTVRGLRTLHLRFGRQQENAARIAEWLEGGTGVARVLYPGLPSHPNHELAKRTLTGFGAMVSFELAGGEAAVDRFIRRLRLIGFSPSLGDNETTVMYPAKTSHRGLTPEGKLAAGAGPGLVRLSAGTEDLHDLLGDLEQALGG